MTLKEYLKNNKLSTIRFAKKIGVSQPVCCMWANDKRFPNSANMKKIFMATGGQVKPSDFYGIGHD